ncbi:hypothetical protein SVIOM74S_04780 [Streptomyces violarus]
MSDVTVAVKDAKPAVDGVMVDVHGVHKTSVRWRCCAAST